MSRALKSGLYFGLSLLMLGLLKFFPRTEFAARMQTSTVGFWTFALLFFVLFFVVMTLREALVKPGRR